MLLEVASSDKHEGRDSGPEPSQITAPNIQQQRDEIQALISAKWEDKREGDRYCLVPQDWYNLFIGKNNDGEEVAKLGPIDTTVLLDESGVLLRAPQDPSYMPSISLPEQAFAKLQEWYGSTGDPVVRQLIKVQDNSFEVELSPPVFFLHALVPAGYINRIAHVHPKPLLLSRKTELRQVKDAVKRQLSIQTIGLSLITRLWVVQSSKEIPFCLTPSVFNEIENKQLLIRSKSDKYKSLAEKALIVSHVVIEVKQKEHQWPSSASKELVMTDGRIGLQNLGNSCYMNSALQCLVHIPELSFYFLQDYFKDEINTDNPLGNHGKIALAFGSLIHTLFSQKHGSQLSYITPRDFKMTIGFYNSMFAGYHQQDSQEFLAYLLDGLHEDLNRILKKPYVEKPELEDDKVNNPTEIRKFAEKCWELHKLRNNSIIIDLFVGLYKSTLVCPECGKISITFDPYNDLTLPLPISKKWSHKVKILLNTGYPKVLEVELNKSATFGDLKRYVAQKIGVDAMDLIGVEIFNSQFYKNYESKDSDATYLPISELVSDGDDIWFYQVDHKDDDLIVPVFSTISSGAANSSKPFSIPFFITLSPEEKMSYGAIREKLEKRYDQLSTYNYFTQVRSRSKAKHDIEDFPLLKRKLEDEADTVEEIDGESDSDISLANPDIPGNYAFQIKTFDSSREVKQTRFTGYGPKYTFGKNDDPYDEDDSLWLPRTNAYFSNLPDLLDKLGTRKRQFYTYHALGSDTSEVNSLADGDQEPAATIDQTLEADMNDTALQAAVSADEINSDTSSEVGLASLVADTDVPFDHPPLEAVEEDTDHPWDGCLISEKMALVCEWDQDLFDTFFTGIEDEGEGGTETWTKPEIIPNEELEESRRILAEKATTNITLEDCLNMFSTAEVLGEHDLWYCPKCKDHRQATKKIEIWSVPDVLTIHLKRFENQRTFSDKIDAVVDFPIEGLDMTTHVVNPEGQELIYDLFAVDNHYGGLGGGHYTAYVKNFVDNKWYYYDDSRVSPADPQSAIKGSAYLLFYRKRTSEPLGGEHLRKVMEHARTIKQKTPVPEEAVDVSNVSPDGSSTDMSDMEIDKENGITPSSCPPSPSVSPPATDDGSENRRKRHQAHRLALGALGARGGTPWTKDALASEGAESVGSPFSDDDACSIHSSAALAPIVPRSNEDMSEPSS